jgi:pimeloyl-ACP methyl ester carboxylesterase
MKYKIFTSVIAGAVIVGLAAYSPGGQRASAQGNEGNYASINSLEMYYEVHGEGEPLIMIHGGLGGVAEFGQLPSLLSETRQVIAVELQAHGRTADIDRPLSFEFMADDIAALIEHLGFENADIMGFSMGGGVALQTATRHPEVVRRLVLVSTAYSTEGIHQEFRAGMAGMSAESAAMMLETPMYQLYSSVAPNLENWATLVAKLGELLRPDYDWSEDVAGITIPTLIIAGDSDFIYPSHAVGLLELLGGGVAGGMVETVPTAQLAILPGVNHFAIISRTDLLLPLINPFLDAPMPQAE